MKKLIPILFLLVLISCGSGERGVSSSSGTTDVQINIGQQEVNSADVSPSYIPASVYTVKIIITDGDGGDELVNTEKNVRGLTSVDFNFSVPNGNNRHFIVSAYCSDGCLLYSGSTTADLTGSAVSLEITLYAVD